MSDSEQANDDENLLDSRAVAAAAHRSIVMVGLMGAGKSSIGRRLATRLEMPFADADMEIEAAAGCSITEFFARHGEVEFREGERRVIARLLEGAPIVLATGGGAFMDEDTRAAVAKSGISVWLRADLNTLVRRTALRNSRPLLNNADPARSLEDLMKTRYPVYALADITVESDDGPLDATVARVVDALAAYNDQAEVAPAQ